MILNNAEGIYLGNNEVQKIYKGETLIWQKQQNQNTSIPADYILALDFNGDFVDKAGNYTMLPGISGLPEFVEGRKKGSYASSFFKGRGLLTLERTNINADFTASVWIKTTMTEIGYILYNANSDQAGGFILRTRNSKISTFVYASGYYINQCHSNVVINDNGWHHLMMIVGGGFVSLIVDGVLSKEPARVLSPINRTQMSIGFFTMTNSSYNYTGLMQDLRIYNRVLNDAEIQSLYNE